MRRRKIRRRIHLFVDHFYTVSCREVLPAGDVGGCVYFLPSLGCEPERLVIGEQPWSELEQTDRQTDVQTRD